MQQRVTLSLKIPKNDQSNLGPIVAEQIFTTISAINEEIPRYKHWFGIRDEAISFEIVNRDKLIKFYVNCPSKHRNLVENQIYAHYPNVEIAVEADYIEKKTKKIYFTALKQANPVIYPIKRYGQFEDRLAGAAVDPIAGITSTIASLPNIKDEVWIQFIIHPLQDKWRVKYRDIVRIIKYGVFGNIAFLQQMYIRVACTRKIWPRILFWPIYFALWLQRLTIGFRENRGRTENDLMEGNIVKRHDRETLIESCNDKVNKLLFEASIQIAYLSNDRDSLRIKEKVKEIAGAFKQFKSPVLNYFIRDGIKHGANFYQHFKHRAPIRETMVLNVEELATLYHLPSEVVQTPNIDWIGSRKFEPPLNLPTAQNTAINNLTLLGKTNYRNTEQVYGIKNDPDRRRHSYIIGKTGMGKTTLLENMIFSDIINGKGVGIIDPHGDLAERVLDFVPKHRINDVIIFDPADTEYPIAFNMLEVSNPALATIVASGLIGIFKKLFAHSWGPRLEHILRNTILTLITKPGTSMLGIVRILQDTEYREKFVSNLKDPILASFWQDEFAKMPEKMRVEAIAPVLNKVGQFLSSPLIRNIVGQSKSRLDLRYAMDKGKIVVCNLSKGKIGEDNSSLLGSMLITKFQLDAMSRADIVESDRRDFYLYVDEFQNFATQSFATILSEARKYRLNLTMANQYIAQMPQEVRDAVFGNVGTIISFQVGYDDADYLAQQLGDNIKAEDLIGLNKYTTYTRLLIDGMPSRTFSSDTLTPPKEAMVIDEEKRNKIINQSRNRYTETRADIEDKISRWSNTEQKIAREKDKINKLNKPEIDLEQKNKWIF